MTTTTLAGVRGYRRFALANTFTKAVDDRLLLTVIAGVAMGLMNLMMGPMYLALEDVLAEMLAQMPEVIESLSGVDVKKLMASFPKSDEDKPAKGGGASKRKK